IHWNGRSENSDDLSQSNSRKQFSFSHEPFLIRMDVIPDHWNLTGKAPPCVPPGQCRRLSRIFSIGYIENGTEKVTEEKKKSIAFSGQGRWCLNSEVLGNRKPAYGSSLLINLVGVVRCIGKLKVRARTWSDGALWDQQVARMGSFVAGDSKMQIQFMGVSN